MSLDRLGAWRLPFVAIAALVVALGVVGFILLLGRTPGIVNSTPSAPPSTPSSTLAATPMATPLANDPEAAVRAFFEAFAQARETGDPTIVEPFVNGTHSSAYLTVTAFVGGQTEAGKASIVTVSEFSNVEVTIDGDTAVVEFDHLLGGFDIDLDSAEPLESPMVLPLQRKVADLVLVDGVWLVDRFENVP